MGRDYLERECNGALTIWQECNALALKNFLRPRVAGHSARTLHRVLGLCLSGWLRTEMADSSNARPP